MTHAATLDGPVGDLERIVVASVALTARVLAEVAPELTFLQWRVLVVVAADPGGASVGAVAAELGAKLAATSRLVGRLRDRGLVTTAKDSSDNRVTLVRLTEAGDVLRAAVVERRRTILAWSVKRGGLSIADVPTADRMVRALEAAR